MSSIPQSEARHEPHVDTSDWEYEYDDNETEDIYFTLDLTTYVPNAIQEKQYAKNGRLIGAADPEKNVQSDANAQLAPIGNDEDDGAANDAPAEISAPRDAGRLQILDLHTERPYVKYNNGFYSCHWFTDLGTQFWLTNPGAVRDPKFSGHVLDVVGSSQTRLVARPANLKRKRDDIDPAPTEGETAAQSIAINDDAASDVSDAESRSNALDTEQDPTKPMVIPRQKIKDPHLEAQANFMERLYALKLKKGEKDAHSIPMKVPVYYKGARNADELRASHGVVRAEVEVDELQPATIPDVSRVSPAADNANADDAGEGAPADEDGAAPSPPRSIRRPRGSSRARRGGVVSNAARRSNLGLELADASSLPKKKRGRPSNAEKALRAQQAEAAALAASQQVAGPDSNTSFALDPQLGGGLTDAGASPATREVSAAPSSTQGDQAPPRKGRRSKAQLEEARRLEEERQARLSKAPSAANERSESGDAAPGREQRPARKTRSSGAAEEFGAGNGTEDPQVEGEES